MARPIANAICASIGIDPNTVTKLTVCCDPNDIERIVIEVIVPPDDAPGVGDTLSAFIQKGAWVLHTSNDPVGV